MGYQLNVKAIQESFNITSGKVKHNPLVRSKWLPYTVNFDENKQNVFVEVVAEFVRLISKKGQVKSVTMEELLDQVLQNPNLKVEANHRSHLKELLQTLFFTEEGKLYLFHPKILYYLPSSKENSKMGHFLRDVLWDQTLFTGSDQHDEPSDAVTKLLFESFMPLETKVEKEDVLPYQKALPIISDLFTADYSWLTHHPDLFVLHVEKLMIFYYFFYVSQFALTGKAMFSTTGENISPVYFNLEWESISQTRTSYLQGWKKTRGCRWKVVHSDQLP